MADERSDLPGYGPGEPRESWATPKQASTFFGTWVHKFEKDGGIHNQQRVPNETWEQLVSEARETLGWQGVKIDLYTLDHSVREVDKTFTQLGWHFDQNRPNPSELDEPATVATAHEAMRLLERYYSSYEPNELPKGTSLLEPVDEKKERVEAEEFRVKDLEKLELPFTVRGTKRGGLPVLEEKHKHNYVTMVKNVEGDRRQLLLELRNFIGAGGHTSPHDENAIEIQGRHQEKVEDFLVLRQCLVGVSAAGAAAAAERTVNQTLEEGSGAGAGKKLKEGMQRGKDKKAKRERKQRRARGEDVDDDETAAAGDGEGDGGEEASEFGEKDKKKKKKKEKKEKKEKEAKDVDYLAKLQAKLADKSVEKAAAWWVKTLNKSTLTYTEALGLTAEGSGLLGEEVDGAAAAEWAPLFLPLLETPKAELHMCAPQSPATCTTAVDRLSEARACGLQDQAGGGERGWVGWRAGGLSARPIQRCVL